MQRCGALVFVLGDCIFFEFFKLKHFEVMASLKVVTELSNLFFSSILH